MSQILPATDGIRNRRRIVLHAGFPKTGTTFIQNRLYKHRELLISAHGILMPSLSANLTDALCTMFHDDPIVHITNLIDQLSPDQLEQRKMGFFQRIEEELSNSSWNTVILSAEGVANLNFEELRKLKQWGDTFDVDWLVFYCVREPIDWVRSVVQELIKGGKTLDQLYSDLPLPHFRRQIELGIDVFGLDALRVYTFAAASDHPLGILGHFLNMLDLPAALLSNEEGVETRENSSMSREAVMILDRLNTVRPLFDEQGKLGKQRTGQETINLLEIKGSTFQLPMPIEQRVRQAAMNDERWLKDIFDIKFDRPATARCPSDYASFSASTITSVAILISNLLNQVRSQSLAPQINVAREKSNSARAAVLIDEIQRLAAA